MKDWKRHLNLGLEILSYVCVFFFSGYYLDLYFDTSPVFMIFGVAMAIVSVFYILWKRYLKK